MDFRSAYAHGFARIAACTLPTALADPATNAARILDVAAQCHADAVAVAVFPDLCVSGYSLEDLFLQDSLLDATQEALRTIVEASRDLLPVLVVGAPLRNGARLYNGAVVIHRGTILGVAFKQAAVDQEIQ